MRLMNFQKMVKSSANLLKFLLPLVIVLFAACGDDDGDEPNTGELLIGIWTTSNVVEVTTEVDGQSVTDYLINEVGMAPTDAAAQEAIIQASLSQEVSGTLTLNADNTYMSTFNGGSDSGTWSLGADQKTLTLLEGSDTIIIIINSISATTMNVSTGDTLLMDLDDDPGTPDVEVEASATVIFDKA